MAVYACGRPLKLDASTASARSPTCLVRVMVAYTSDLDQ